MQYIAVYRQQFVAKGELAQVVEQAKALGQDAEAIVIEEESCRRIEIDWRADTAAILADFPAEAGSSGARRGRPKLGVVSKEVTLLPRHWEWLANQRGGASAALRRLVESAQRNASIEDIICEKQQQLDKFMLLFLGDNPGFEEASRALYRNSRVSFCAAIESWPAEIQQFVVDKFSAIAKLHNGEDE